MDTSIFGTQSRNYLNRKIDAKESLVIEGKCINRLCLRSL